MMIDPFFMGFLLVSPQPPRYRARQLTTCAALP